MKQSIINVLSILFLLLFTNIDGYTQNSENNSQLQTNHHERRWDKRKHLQYKGWEKLKPTHIKMQYAGGMGLLSTGIGWDYGRRCQWESDFLLG